MTKHVFILGTPGRIPINDSTSKQEIVKAIGQNTGNLVFQSAVANFLDPSTIHFFGRGFNPTSELGKLKKELNPCAFVLPLANHLRAGNELTSFSKMLYNANIPLLVFGLGAQASTTEVDSDEFRNITTDPSLVDFVNILQNRSRYVFVRGEFTKKVVSQMGLADCAPTGCPSLLINCKKTLGQEIQSSFEKIYMNGASRLVLTAANHIKLYKSNPKFASLERHLYSICSQHSFIYVQQSGGAEALFSFYYRVCDKTDWYTKIQNMILFGSEKPTHSQLSLLQTAMRCYFNIRNWKSDLETADLSLGTRMHGNMLALGVGTPAVLITHDSRTEELADLMEIPRVTSDVASECQSIQELISKVVFDPTRFDNNRRDRALTYLQAIECIGAKPSKHLQHLAS